MPSAAESTRQSFEGQFDGLTLRLGYLVALALLGQYLAQVVGLGGEAAPVGSVRWRFGLTGTTIVSMGWLLLALGAATVSATLLNRPRILQALSSLGWGLAILSGGALIFFALDFLQLRTLVAEGAQRKFTIVSLRTGTIAVAAMVVLVLLAQAAWRSAAHSGRHGSQRQR